MCPRYQLHSRVNIIIERFWLSPSTCQPENNSQTQHHQYLGPGSCHFQWLLLSLSGYQGQHLLLVWSCHVYQLTTCFVIINLNHRASKYLNSVYKLIWQPPMVCSGIEIAKFSDSYHDWPPEPGAIIGLTFISNRLQSFTGGVLIIFSDDTFAMLKASFIFAKLWCLLCWSFNKIICSQTKQRRSS